VLWGWVVMPEMQAIKAELYDLQFHPCMGLENCEGCRRMIELQNQLAEFERRANEAGVVKSD